MLSLVNIRTKTYTNDQKREKSMTMNTSWNQEAYTEVIDRYPTAGRGTIFTNKQKNLLQLFS